jgi:predicted nucleotidyltransferase
MATSDVPTANARTPIRRARRAIDAGLIKHVTDTIVAHFDPERVILFGSQARADAGPDSDLDIFVEMETKCAYSSSTDPT